MLANPLASRKMPSRGLAPAPSKLEIGGEYSRLWEPGSSNHVQQYYSSVICYARTLTLLPLYLRHSAAHMDASFGRCCSCHFFSTFFPFEVAKGFGPVTIFHRANLLYRGHFRDSGSRVSTTAGRHLPKIIYLPGLPTFLFDQSRQTNR